MNANEYNSSIEPAVMLTLDLSFFSCRSLGFGPHDLKDGDRSVRCPCIRSLLQ
jgi:hypothetical protein